MKLTDEQKEIINYKGNLIVQANAGTGKTFTMVNKIEKEISENKTYKSIAAITFTIKAANEIKDRITSDISKHFIGTNNSFAIGEIIKPFMKDVFGLEFDIDMDTDYIQKFDFFEEGIEKLKNTKTLGAYTKTEKNFIFELALKILKKSEVCQLYLKSKYFKIYIDEYQDCDEDMSNFFMYICDELKIETFIIGDSKQSIYIWRGAYPEAFDKIRNKENFHSLELNENFRSCQQIQNYSNLLSSETSHLYKAITEKNNIILLNSDGVSWKARIMQYLDAKKKIILLRYSNKNAETNAKEMSNDKLGFVYIPKIPISDISTSSSWLYLAVARYIITENYSVYDFNNEIPSNDETKPIKIIEMKLKDIKNSLQNKEKFFSNIKNIATYLSYAVEKENLEKLYKTILNKEYYYPAFNVEKYDYVAMTFHSSKGLEYEQVIIFGEDYSEIESKIYNHYVAVTRAKEKLIIINNTEDFNANKFLESIKKIFNKANISFNEIVTIIE